MVKKAAKEHEDYFSKLSITARDSSILRKEKPITYEPKPFKESYASGIYYKHLY